MAHGSFGTAINCMDGRTQLPVNEYLKSVIILILLIPLPNRVRLKFWRIICRVGINKTKSKNIGRSSWL